MFGAALLDVATSFPAVIYTVLFGVSLTYWAFVALGAFEMPGLGGGELDGGVKGLFEGASQGLEGGVKGLGEGLASSASLAMGHDRAPRAKAPITVWITVGLAITWTLACSAMQALGSLGDGLLVRLGVLVAAPLLGFTIANPLVRPLGQFFSLNRGQRSAGLRGATAEVTTGRVDTGFGQARVESGGADLLVQVRAPAEAGIRRGDPVLLIDFDEQKGAFLVESMARVLGASHPGEPPQAEARSLDVAETPSDDAAGAASASSRSSTRA